MRQFVLKTPTVLLILIVLFPILSSELLLGNYFAFFQNQTFLIVFELARLIVVYFWFLSLIDFFNHECPSPHRTILITLLTVEFLFLIFDFLPMNFYLILLITSPILVSFIVLFVKLVKSVFYQRSIWFIVLETILIPVGIFTLTEQVKMWEDDKNSDHKLESTKGTS